MNTASFSRTPLDRAFLHAACLCRHPAAARFFLTGLTRNLREWQQRVPSALESMKKLWLKIGALTRRFGKMPDCSSRRRHLRPPKLR